jgi:disulfide bond formation protein DsbB
MPRNYWALDGLFGVPVRASIRILQFVLAVVTIGLVAVDLSSVESQSTHIYALVAAVISILIDVYHCLATVNHGAWYALDFSTAILWAALAGAIGSSPLEDARPSSKHKKRMVAITVIGVISLALWVGSCVLGCAWCWATRKSKKTRSVELAEVG